MTNYSQGTGSGEFNIGALISESFAVLHRALPRFLALGLIPIVPLIISTLVIGVPTPENPFPNVSAIVVLMLIYIALLFIIQGGMIYGAFNELRGQNFSVGDALSKGLSRFLPLLGLSILVGLGIAVGLMLLIVPGLWLICMLYAAVAVCVVEQRGVTDSMSRSGELTSGFRWQILGLVLIVGIAGWIVAIIIEYIGGGLGGPIFGALLGNLFQVYLTALGSVLTALVYYRLRSIKEGIDIDRLADVFD
ncbi:hypothetical protein BA190_29100 [Labrys sp. WJW]|uniref:hypothetical protein n=1 Tax=Labrys sp. WJW TaxID=1737983 RepID=UPI000833C332|nr:hypothetical protein [Labrys sp. WJW]OCC01538.1 hypothetical protein BA190_29100 [Labrys sp. WJW]